jgi:transcriptional regulator with XRE-family HTH domain
MTGTPALEPNRQPAPGLEPLWREVLGRKLRMLRLGQGQKLAETAAHAGISPQYLSEIERGLKEPSSEMIAAVAGALGITLLDLTVQLAEDFRDIAASDYSARSDAASLLAGSVFAMAA